MDFINGMVTGTPIHLPAAWSVTSRDHEVPQAQDGAPEKKI